jgi:hypothetical protein
VQLEQGNFPSISLAGIIVFLEGRRWDAPILAFPSFSALSVGITQDVGFIHEGVSVRFEKLYRDGWDWASGKGAHTVAGFVKLCHVCPNPRGLFHSGGAVEV